MRTLQLLLALIYSSGFFVDTAVAPLFSGTVDPLEIVLSIDDSEHIQQINIAENDKQKYLHFSLRSNTKENLTGFDSPYFLVYLNDIIIYEEHFSLLLPDGSFRNISVPLPNLQTGDHHLKLKLQNTGDELHSPTAIVSNIHLNTISPADSLPPPKPEIISIKREFDNQLTLLFNKSADAYAYELKCTNELGEQIFKEKIYPANTFRETDIITFPIPEEQNCLQVMLRTIDAANNYSTWETDLLVL